MTVQSLLCFSVINIMESCVSLSTSEKSFPGPNIEIDLQSICDEIKLKKNIVVRESFKCGLAGASGLDFFFTGNPVILIAPNFYQVDRDACIFAIKHEIHHIKHNDSFTKPFVSAIFNIAACIFFNWYMPINNRYAFPLIYYTGLITQALFSQYLEKKADDFAIANSSNEELKGARRFFIAIKTIGSESRTTLWRKIQISPEGNKRLGFTHPLTTNRLKKVENSLRKKISILITQLKQIKSKL